MYKKYVYKNDLLNNAIEARYNVVNKGAYLTIRKCSQSRKKKKKNLEDIQSFMKVYNIQSFWAICNIYILM